MRRAEPHEYARLIESRALKQADAPGGLTPLKTAQLLKLPLCSIANLDVSGRVPIMGDLADSRSVIGRHGWFGTGGRGRRAPIDSNSNTPEDAPEGNASSVVEIMRRVLSGQR